jgi:hypothetical protein
MNKHTLSTPTCPLSPSAEIIHTYTHTHTHTKKKKKEEGEEGRKGVYIYTTRHTYRETKRKSHLLYTMQGHGLERRLRGCVRV